MADTTHSLRKQLKESALDKKERLKKHVAHAAQRLDASRHQSPKSLQRKIDSLAAQVQALEGKLSLQDNHVLVGEKFNLPAQPEPKSKGGVWEDAPLALAVSGGIALHNIGYTNKKGMQLTVDPETQRLLIFHGK